MLKITLPPRLLEAVDPDKRDFWLGALPERVAILRRDWELEIAEPFSPGGVTAWVAPARMGDRTEAVLKVGYLDEDTAGEADGLRVWNGHGTVRLLSSRRWGDAYALLLERCIPGEPLSRQPELLQDEVVADLLRRLWIEPPENSRFATLTSMCQRWAQDGEQTLRRVLPVADWKLADAGLELFRTLPQDSQRQVLLCTDLHAANILASAREPWLVIDPKPFVGDPTYDALQHLLNCTERLREDPEGTVARISHLLDLDGRRLKLWLFSRCVIEAQWDEKAFDLARTFAP